MEETEKKTSKKQRPKWVNWVARISTTFGLAGVSWLYLWKFSLAGGVFFLGLLCGLTTFEYLKRSKPELPMLRKILLSLVNFFIPYAFHRILGKEDPSSTIFLYEILMGIFIATLLASLKIPAVLRTVSRTLLFPTWGITLPMTALIVTAHLFIDQGRNTTEALLWVIVIIFITKSTDIGALLVGSWLGKHKLAPKTSPGKTIEGAIGGVVVSVLVALTIYCSFEIKLHPGIYADSPLWWNLTKVILTTVLIATSGILGDLFESSWKRHIQIKDSGTMLPGLGGMYDLTDSIILSAPVAYFLIKYWVLAV